MGIFSAHHQTNTSMKSATSNHEGYENEKSSETSGNSGTSSSSHTHSNTSAQKASCGCGSCHKAKPIEDETVEIKEEWDY